MTQVEPCSISNDQAHQIVSMAIASLKESQNEQALKHILQECAKEENPMTQFQLKFSKLIPKVTEIFGAEVESVLGLKIDQNQVMGYVMQIQMLAVNDLSLALQIGKVMKTLSGDFSGLYEEDDDGELEEIE